MSTEPLPLDITTVGPRSAVAHQGTVVHRRDDLTPGETFTWFGEQLTALPEPGPLLARFGTVNDVHLGEVECGVIEGSDVGPTFRSAPGEDPYPEVMNRGAVAEMVAAELDAVVVKGDLTSTGTTAEHDAFRGLYEPAFGDRLCVVRGNHDSYYGGTFAATPWQQVTLPGAQLAVLDSARDHQVNGSLSTEQLEWLDALAAEADRPVLVFTHHQVWDPASAERDPDYFGIAPDDSERLLAVIARRPRIVGTFAGHTHRSRVRRFAVTGDVVHVEVACVKDFPGVWAEYRVHEGGILQVVHRISTPEALAWTEQTRHMYEGLYAPYALGALADRCFAFGMAR